MPNKPASVIRKAVSAGVIGLALGGCATIRPVKTVPKVGSVGANRSIELGSSTETGVVLASSSSPSDDIQGQPENRGDTELSSPEIPINLPSALARIGGTHPVVGHAQWRVQEAYAQLERAELLWLPSIQAGFNYHRHDGNYQAINGSIVDINSNSMQAGLGAGAIAAGTTPRPGLVAQFHLADSIFLPKVAQKTAWAREHAALAAENQQMLTAALAYVELLDAYQDESLLTNATRRLAELGSITREFAQAGSGLVSDAQRLSTEVSLVQVRTLGATERKQTASTRLARALSIPSTSQLLPQDAMVFPLELANPHASEQDLVLEALHRRPELAESQALVAAACEAYNREKSAPFVPSVLLGFSTGTFGGGLGSNAGDWGGRYDVDALMTWELRNLGLGEQAVRRERQAQIQQAMYNKLRIMDQVAQEVSEARVQVLVRQEQIQASQRAVETAEDSYLRNLERIKEGHGLPIEALQSVQALETAERAYLRAVSDHNRAQLQLLWASGWQPPVLADQ